MSSKNTEQRTDFQPIEEDAVTVPEESTQHEKSIQSVKGVRRFIFPAVLGLLLLGGIGWVVFNRVVLPILSMSKNPPSPAISVPLSRAKVTTVEDSSDYAATLDSRQSITVQPKVSGRISAIYVKAGDRIQAGDKLLQMDAVEQRAQVASLNAGINTAAAEVESAKADIVNARDTLNSLKARQDSAQANVQLNQADYKRFQALYKAGATSQQSLDQKLNAIQTAQAALNQAKADVQAQQSAIAKAKAQRIRNEQAVNQAKANVVEGRAKLQDYAITAPFSGIVGNIPAKLGDIVSATTPLLTITQNQQLEVLLQIPLERSAALRQGQLVKLLDDKGRALGSGQISFIAPNVDPSTQSVQAKAMFANVGNSLRTAQFVRARVIWAVRPGLLVPTTAISRLGGRDFVFVAEPFQRSGCKAATEGQGGGAPVKIEPNQTVAVQKPIQLGKIIGNNQEVLKGLSAGDRIVTSGILQLQHCLPIAGQISAGSNS
jgi:multidrug efflux pump subunit AcrA (membrane-fusion protein)